MLQSPESDYASSTVPDSFDTHILSVNRVPRQVQDTLDDAVITSHETVLASATAAAAATGNVAKEWDGGRIVGLLEELVCIAGQKNAANRDVKYWSEAPQPWRNGTDDTAMTDADMIAWEEGRKAAAEAEND